MWTQELQKLVYKKRDKEIRIENVQNVMPERIKVEEDKNIGGMGKGRNGHASRWGTGKRGEQKKE